MSTGTNPYRNPGEIILAANTIMEIPTPHEKQNLIFAVKTMVNSADAQFNPVMREKRLSVAREFILRRMDKIITETARDVRDDWYYYIPVPFLRDQFDKRFLIQECDYLSDKLRTEFAEKGWDLYIKLSKSAMQPWNWKFWKQEKTVILFTILTLKPA